MAKLSTGASYGDTNQQTSQRLVGGAEQMTSGGELAQRAIQTAAIQPVAAPVNTYQQVGAPTLGGPVKFFAPPDLPAPSQDLANLAKSLGGFSTALGDFGDFYAKKQEYDQQKADIESQQAAQALSVAFPGQQLAQVRDSLYRQAAAGDADARSKYEYLQAMSPMTLAFVQRNLARAVYRQALAAAPSKWEQTAEVPGPDGKPISVTSLRPGDPLLTQAWSSLLPTINDPVVAKEFEAQSYGLLTQLSATHNKIVIAEDKRIAMAIMGKISQQIVNPAMSEVEALAIMDGTLKDARQALGPEGYQELVQSIQPMLLASGAFYNKEGIDPRVGQRIEVLIKKGIAGANGQTISDRLGEKGGDAATLEIVRTQLSNSAVFRDTVQQTADMEGKNIATQLFESLDLRNPNLSPTERRSRVDQGRQSIATLIEDPATRLAASSYLDRLISPVEDAFTKPRERELEIRAQEIAYNTGMTAEQKRAALASLESQGLDPLKARPYYESVSNDLKRENAPYVEFRDKTIKDLVTQLTDSLTASEGGLNNEERSQINKYRRGLQEDVAQLERAGRAKGLSSDQITDNVDVYLKRKSTDLTTGLAERARQSYVPVVPNIGTYSSGPTMKQRLTASVTSQPILPEEVFLKELDDAARSNTISPSMRQIIKDSGYAGRAGDFFKAQWKTIYKDGRPIPQSIMDRLDSMNQHTVSFAAPNVRPQMGPSPQATHVNDVASLLRGMANQTVNALIGGASAAPMEAGGAPFSGNPSGEVGRFRRAIIGQESGGNYGAVNPDSGALGIGQVMPENVPSWSRKYLGRSITPEQFLRDRNAQDTIVNGRFNDMLADQRKAGFSGEMLVRRAASVWYSGDASKWNNTRRQRYKGREYPSIAKYTKKIWDSYRRNP